MNGNLVIKIAEAGLLAAVASWALVAVLIRFAPRIGLVDRPNERSLHSRVTPRGGGIGIVVVVVVFMGSIVVWGRAKVTGSEIPLQMCLSTALFVALVSLWDDFKSLGAGLRILCHVAAASLAVWGLASFDVVMLPGLTVDLPAWFGVAVTVVWIVGLTNVYNFMDGIDGIAAVQGVVAGIAWAVAATTPC